MVTEHHYQDLIELFNKTFLEENTRLVKGDDEPLYKPADKLTPYHQIIFAHGFFQSALHEIAHWCIAGKARRELEDYGYWYSPDGRDEATQAEFERLEKRPQALEWFFSKASNLPFNVSCDNLAGDFEPDRLQFHQAVHGEVMKMFEKGLPPRGLRFVKALNQFYGTNFPQREDFHYPETIWDL